MIKIKTQAELNAALATNESEIEICAAINLEINIRADKRVKLFSNADFFLKLIGHSMPRVEARDSSQPRVEAWDSSQPRVVAWDSSQPRVVALGSSQPTVVARDSSQPRVEARDSSQPRVEARDSSQPRVVAWGYASLSLFGKFTAKLSAKCHAVLHNGAKSEGGTAVNVEIKSPKDWCDYYGVAIKRGIAVLYKGVHKDFSSDYDRRFFWTPGTRPEAKKFDQNECSDGLHFVPSPTMARQFLNEKDMKFLACPVRVKDLLIFPDGRYPNKAKAQKVCGDIWEVNEDGETV